MQESTGISQGRCSVNDPGPATQRNASPLGPPLSTDGSPATPPDVSLSEDSLAYSPPQPAVIKARLAARPPRARGRSGSSGRAASAGASVLRTPSSGKRTGTLRAQSPALLKSQVTGPNVVPPQSATPEDRLAALELQRTADHQVMHQMVAAIHALQETTNRVIVKEQHRDVTSQEQIQMGLQLRREIAAVRVPTTPETAAATSAHITAICEAKFGQLDTLIAQLQQREANVETVMQSEHDKAKEIVHQDGTFPASTLNTMDSRLSQVSELVQKFG